MKPRSFDAPHQARHFTLFFIENGAVHHKLQLFYCSTLLRGVYLLFFHLCKLLYVCTCLLPPSILIPLPPPPCFKGQRKKERKKEKKSFLPSPCLPSSFLASFLPSLCVCVLTPTSNQVIHQVIHQVTKDECNSTVNASQQSRSLVSS